MKNRCLCDKPCECSEFHLGKSIHELDNLIYRNMLAQGRKYGYDQITVMNGWIVKYLALNEDKDIFQKDIENEFGITKSTVAGIIKLMEKKGFIERVSVPKDARLKKIVLTEKALQFREQVMEDLAGLEQTLTAGVSRKDLATFFKVMDTMMENMSE